MTDQDGFDARLAARFDQAHRILPADPFVASTMRKIRARRRHKEVLRVGLRVALLAAAIAASPWLTAGAVRLSAALESSLAWTMGLPGALVGMVVIALLVALRLRRR